MRRRPARFLVVLAVCAATTAVVPAAHADPPTELLGDGGTPIPLKDAAMIVKSEWGYRFIAGQQNSHITITEVAGQLLYVDTGTKELRDIPKSCAGQAAPTGIAVLCKIPKKFKDADEMFLEVWPRLGDDFVDGSTLPAKYRLWTLADAGEDRVYGGAGDDFVNGAQDDDKVFGGAGNDWLRTGIGDDEIWGGPGDDKLVGVDGKDEIHGGEGDDRVGGGSGRDLLWADTGKDIVACGGGRDDAYVDGSDRTSQCESLAAY